MTEAKDTPNSYLDTLLLYYEEEIMGEAYFYGLAEHFDEPGQKTKLNLLAEVERHAAEAVRPLLSKHHLVPRSDAELGKLESEQIKAHGAWSWSELVNYMAERFPQYMDEFEGLESLAPAEDLPTLKFLTAHEVAAIEFADMEVARNPGSVEPLRRYLATQPPAV